MSAVGRTWQERARATRAGSSREREEAPGDHKQLTTESRTCECLKATNSAPASYSPPLCDLTPPLCFSSGYLIVRCIFILFLRTLVTHSPSLYHHFRAMSAVGGANNPNGSLHTLMMRSSTPGAPRVFPVLIIAVRSCPP